MPVYEFVCENCGKRFEEILHIRELETAKPKCPECGSERVRQEVARFFAVTSKKT